MASRWVLVPGGRAAATRVVSGSCAPGSTRAFTGALGRVSCSGSGTTRAPSPVVGRRTRGACLARAAGAGTRYGVTSFSGAPIASECATVAGRTGVRPRGFVLRSYCGNEAARKELAGRWGFPVAPGEVSLQLRHDRVVGKARANGKTVLEIELLDRDAISGNDIQYIASMHLARNKDDQKLVLVQVDPEYAFSKAERGKARVITLDNDAFGAGSHLRITTPIMASFAVADVTLPKIRYICNPELPAMQGTTKVAA